VYFINGTACAGKSSVCKLLAEKYNMYHCEENYKIADFIKLTTKESHPHMNYFNTMSSWEEFVTRDKEDYVAWMDGVSLETAEFEIMELINLVNEKLDKDKKIIVDTNIPHHILKEISDRSRVAYMVSTPEIATNEWFHRMDEEKQFLLNVINNTNNPKENLQKYINTIAYANRDERIAGFINTGYYVVKRTTLDEDILDKLKLIEKHFGLSKD